MPEGDTIYRAARALQKALAGKAVTSFDTGLATLASVDHNTPLVGRVVERVEARGKWCLLYFSGDLILVTHMLMSGSWHIYRTGEKWRMGRNRMRASITCGDFQVVAFNVPIAEFHTARSLERSSQIPRLGPDILSGEVSESDAVESLRKNAASNPDTEIAVALLDQRVIAGLGNVYKSEVAFAAGVHPFRRMSTLTPDEAQKLITIAARYMKANVADGSSDSIVTYTGNRRTTHSMDRTDRLWVYGRHGKECRRCGATIAMRKQGEQARSTYWCPSCQPWIPAAEECLEPPKGHTISPLGKRRNSC